VCKAGLLGAQAQQPAAKEVPVAEALLPPVGGHHPEWWSEG